MPNHLPFQQIDLLCSDKCPCKDIKRSTTHDEHHYSVYHADVNMRLEYRHVLLLREIHQLKTRLAKLKGQSIWNKLGF